MEPIQTRLVEIAHSFLGKTEIIPNKGFHDPEFEKEIRTTGWTPPEPWCAALLKLEFLKGFQELFPGRIDSVHKYFDLSAVDTYNKCKASPDFHVTRIPEPGFAVIFQEGSGPFGHAGLVTGVTGRTFKSIEGNTTDPNHPSGNPREGFIVAEKTHSLDKPFDPHGLNILGFISPVLLN